MSDTCPKCGAAMLDDGPTDDDNEGDAFWTYRCAQCAYYVELTCQEDGTIIAKAHEAEIPRVGPDDELVLDFRAVAPEVESDIIEMVVEEEEG